jgi:hypothetical protein
MGTVTEWIANTPLLKFADVYDETDIKGFLKDRAITAAEYAIGASVGMAIVYALRSAHEATLKRIQAVRNELDLERKRAAKYTRQMGNSSSVRNRKLEAKLAKLAYTVNGIERKLGLTTFDPKWENLRRSWEMNPQLRKEIATKISPEELARLQSLTERKYFPGNKGIRE